MPSQSCGERTSNSTERVLTNESTSKAADRESEKLVQRSQDGLKELTAATSIKVAKASFNQMPFHHVIVTRSPNHMCANSWLTTSATFCRSACVLVAGSTSSKLSR